MGGNQYVIRVFGLVYFILAIIALVLLATNLFKERKFKKLY